MELKKKLNQYEHKEGEYCITFDVASLLTNVPLNDTTEMIVYKIPESEISKRNIKNLLKSVTGGVFQHSGKFYTHIVYMGWGWGSPYFGQF